MSQRDGMRVEQALGRLGPLAILGSAFLLGGLLGAALVSMIAQPAAEALSAYLRDYLTAGQAGKVAVGFWPMLWEQGRFFFGVCVLGLTALGTVGIPVLFGARGFLFACSVAGVCRAQAENPWLSVFLLRLAGASPGDVVSLYLGASGTPYGTYLSAGLLGGLPRIACATVLGGALWQPGSGRFWLSLAAGGALTALSGVIWLLWRRRRRA